MLHSYKNLIIFLSFSKFKDFLVLLRVESKRDVESFGHAEV